MTLTRMSVADLLTALRSPSPAPGGGSASALAGALGASLLAMVGAMPSRLAVSESDVDRLKNAGNQCVQRSERLAALVDRDADAYNLVVEAFRLPKESAPQKALRSGAIQDAMKAATDAPLEVMRECAGAAETAIVIAELGNPNAASDVGVALELLGAGLRGARLNVDINLGSVKDRDYADAARQQAATLTADCDRRVAAARAHLTPAD
jgi:formiminotetrahydrofolate cyclodeaminase